MESPYNDAKETETQPSVDISQHQPAQADTGEEATTLLDPITGMPEKAEGSGVLIPYFDDHYDIPPLLHTYLVSST